MSFQSVLTDSNPGQKQNPVLFILLGASNLARSFYGLKGCIKRCLFPRSVNFIHAMGPGRGYISRGGIFNVTYTPIINCGVLETIRYTRKPNQRVIALITDIGNDIMYGVPSEKIIRGIKYIVDTLSEFETDILITSISVDLKNEISEFYFHILRQIFFPKSEAKYSQTLEAIDAINKYIHKSSNARTTVISDMNQFCGLDKIHYSIFKSHLACSHLASKLIYPLNVKTSPNLKFSELVFSLVNNFSRILLVDMLRMVHKTKETF